MTVQEEVTRRIAGDPLLIKLRRKIDSGTADFKDTAAYSNRAADIMSEIFARRLPEISLAEREALCVELLHDRHTDINELLGRVQRSLDDAQGLHIAPQHAPFNAERAHQIGSSTADPTEPEETRQRRARSATATAARAMHDDYIRKNADFRSKAGLKCYINREAVPACCGWCTKMAGRYVYGEEPEKIYQRHDNCGCSVTFENGRQRQDVWSKRTWEAPKEDAGAGDSVVLTEEQAEKLQAKHGLTLMKKSDIMSLEEWCDKYKPLKSDKAVPALRKESEKWIEALSSEEKRAITKYSRNPGDEGEEKFYYRLNSMLSGKTPKDPTLQYYADIISGSLNKYDLKHAIICYRSVDSNPLQGLSVGDVYTPDQYISTSVTSKGALDKAFKIVILAPPGSNGAYIEKLSEYPKQREFLFNDKCRYTIIELTEDSAVLGVIV